jgi:hypothetical protein
MKNKIPLVIMVLVFLLPLVACYSPYDDGIYRKLDAIYNAFSTNTTSSNISTVIAKPYYVSVAEQEVPDHRAWSRQGYNPDIGITSEDMWFGSIPYVFPTAASQMRVVSTSAQDGVGGSGALTVWVNYLDSNYIEKTTTVTMNGLTDVNTAVTDIFRIQNFRVALVGGSAGAAGNISIRHITGATVYGYIQAGFTRARNQQWTVPAGYSLYVTDISFSCSGTKAVRFTTRATWDNARQTALTAGTFFMAYNEVILIDQAYTRTLNIPTRLPQKTDIKVSVYGVNSSGAAGTSSLGGWIEKE